MGPQPETIPGRHWITRHYGDINNLKLEDISVPPPGPKEIRISVRAIGLNFADCFAVLGLYEEAGPTPLTPGFEVSGVVESVGSDVTKFAVGDRVWALKRFGSYATAVNISEVYAKPLKDGWSFAEAAAFPAQAFTAWYALCVLGAMPPNAQDHPRHVTSRRRAVLVHSAAGGVGLQLVEMIRHIGGIAVCTVGSEEKARLLHERCGIPRERVIVRGIDDKADSFESVVRERALGGEGGLDVVVDSVLGDYFAPGFELLNPGGRYIVMGSASIMPRGGISLFRLSGWRNLIQLGWQFLNRPKLDLLMTINKNKTVSGFNVLGIFSEVDFLVRGFDELDSMDLPKPLVGRTFSFENTLDALQYFQSGKSVGKIVLEVNGRAT